MLVGVKSIVMKVGMEGPSVTQAFHFGSHIVSKKNMKQNPQFELEKIHTDDQQPLHISIKFESGRKAEFTAPTDFNGKQVMDLYKEYKMIEDIEEAKKILDEKTENPFAQMAEQFRERQKSRAKKQQQQE